MSITERSFRVPAGYTTNSNQQVSYDKVYIGFVKDTKDVQRMGRLRVYIPEMGGEPDDETKWVTVRYVSPFAGATSPTDNLVKGSEKMADAQRSYGWWGIPPDNDNEVVVVFVNGDPGRGLVMGFLYQQFMNHMVPGIPSDPSFQTDDTDGVNPPTVEYNKWIDPNTNQNRLPPDPKRARFEPLHAGLKYEGLYHDPQRGTSTAGARRGDVAKVYGFKSPQGAQLYMDDEESNEYVRIRTKGGTQILVHETDGYVYINSRNGNSWIEVSDTGIDLYTNRSVSVRAKKDINLRGDNNVNIEAGNDVNIRSCLGTMKLVAESSTMHLRAKGSLHLDTAADINQKASGSLVASAGGTISLGTPGTMIHSAGQIRQNSGGGASAAASEAPQTQDLPDVALKAPSYPKSKSVNTILTRMPHHEPWVRENATPPVTIEHKGGLNPGTIQQEEKIKSNDPAPDKEPEDNIKKSDLPASKALDVNKSVEECIVQASEKTGVHVGYMFAMAQQESSFDPRAQAGTSSAKGLYQFINGTWTAMVKQYGGTYGIQDTLDDKFNACKNAMMGALYARDNGKYLRNKLGREPGPTELYLAHFLGTGGAAKFLSADTSAVAAGVIPSAAASNRPVFYDKAGNARTVQEVYSYFEKKIDPPSKAYFAKYGGSTTSVA